MEKFQNKKDNLQDIFFDSLFEKTRKILFESKLELATPELVDIGMCLSGLYLAKKHVNNNPDRKRYGGDRNIKRYRGEEHNKKSKKIRSSSDGGKRK